MFRIIVRGLRRKRVRRKVVLGWVERYVFKGWVGERRGERRVWRRLGQNIMLREYLFFVVVVVRTVCFNVFFRFC